MPKSDTVVMLVTVITVVATDNLSIGVICGVILSAVFFAAKISKIQVETNVNQMTNTKTYYVTGQLFFASVTEFVSNFDYNDSYESIIINLTNTHIWDDSAVGAIDKIVLKYREKNKHVKIVGLNQPSSALMDKLAVHNK